MTPEAEAGGPLARLRDGDVLRLDAETGQLDALVDPAEWDAREPMTRDLSSYHEGMGRELFSVFRAKVSGAAEGATVFPFLDGERP